MLEDKKTLLVLNPAAGKGKGQKFFPNIRSRLESSLAQVVVQVSENPGHLFKIGSQAVNDGIQRIISVGGDGTPFELINGAIAAGAQPAQIDWGIIPAGTGNSFLRDFYEGDHETALERILDRKSRRTDLIEFSYHREGKPITRYFLNIMGIGLIADILKLTNEKLKPLGAFGYSAAVLIRLFRGMRNRLLLTVDGKEHELIDSALVINNSKFTGGNMKIAPMAHTADGKVEAVVFNKVNRRDIINIFSRVFKGTHIDHPRVKVFSGSQMSLTCDPPELLMADGELLGHTPMTLKVLPSALNILV